IAALEREVGTALFDRTPSGVYPTAAGEAFLARARRVLEEAAAASTDARRGPRRDRTIADRLHGLGTAGVPARRAAPLPRGSSRGPAPPGGDVQHPVRPRGDRRDLRREPHPRRAPR